MAFREPILTKRCLIPADGFYEWRKMGSMKQPYCFEVDEGDIFALAGLWDQRTSRATISLNPVSLRGEIC